MCQLRDNSSSAMRTLYLPVHRWPGQARPVHIRASYFAPLQRIHKHAAQLNAPLVRGYNTIDNTHLVQAVNTGDLLEKEVETGYFACGSTPDGANSDALQAAARTTDIPVGQKRFKRRRRHLDIFDYC